jgi:hypothetical protein
MKAIFYTRFILILFLVVAANIALAQTPAKPVAKPIEKYKPPVVQSYLGNITGKAVATGVEEAKNVIALPLKIIDDKKNNYTVVSYQFAYKRIGITEDEETGKTSPESDMVSNQFTSSPLPSIWQTNIIEGLHKGESLHFFDIIALDKQGRRFFAPELKITVQ